MKILEVSKVLAGDFLEVTVRGRLDGHWADHLRDVLLEEVREGAHKIRLNTESLDYISSAGLGALIEIRQRLTEIQGTFTVANPTKNVLRVIQLSGLQEMLMPALQTETVVPFESKSQVIDLEQARFEIFDCVKDATLEARLVGKPGIELNVSGKQDCRSIPLPESVMAVGLGAFGDEFHDCSSRFGEFLAAAGAAVYQPTDGSSIPDFNLSAAAFVPVMNVLYALVCEGPFARVMHFERKKQSGPIGLSDLASMCLKISASECAGIVIVAESAGLIGASLRKPPAQTQSDPFEFPEVRDLLSFSPEHIFPRSMTLVCGIAAASETPALKSFIRPLGPAALPAGHFHAASFSYRPMKKSETDLRRTITNLFETESLEGVLHLLCDDREIAGGGQSQFIRGACWTAPIRAITLNE